MWSHFMWRKLYYNLSSDCCSMYLNYRSNCWNQCIYSTYYSNHFIETDRQLLLKTIRYVGYSLGLIPHGAWCPPLPQIPPAIISLSLLNRIKLFLAIEYKTMDIVLLCMTSSTQSVNRLGVAIFFFSADFNILLLWILACIIYCLINNSYFFNTLLKS